MCLTRAHADETAFSRPPTGRAGVGPPWSVDGVRSTVFQPSPAVAVRSTRRRGRRRSCCGPADRACPGRAASHRLDRLEQAALLEMADVGRPQSQPRSGLLTRLPLARAVPDRGPDGLPEGAHQRGKGLCEGWWGNVTNGELPIGAYVRRRNVGRPPASRPRRVRGLLHRCACHSGSSSGLRRLNGSRAHAARSTAC